ncbi:centrosome-associated protein ALMS1 [Sorex araneus]|uniref:centrosome-associated protein ALMS1 n=1 Tax=Sorex araneus TaxID=42254 RepID=UPI002433BB33|nr:centrosome-associated protein ALMS1 [Sorex araneus]
MEPEDLPWPGELEEEEPEAEEGEDADEGEEAAATEESLEDEVVVVQEVEDEKGTDSDCDYRCVPRGCRDECQERECTDDEDDEGARAWLQACPDRVLPARSIPQPRPPHAKPGPPHQMVLHVRQQSVCQDKSGKQISDSHVFPLGKIQQSSKDDKVDHSSTVSGQTFSSVLPPFVPEPTTKSDFHSVDLRMLRISSDTMPDSHQYLAAWNLKFNLAREYECGYSISELNEDDRKKVEEIKEKFFIQGRTADLSKSLQSSREVGCKPDAVCSHIIIESHEKGCLSTVTAEQPELDNDSCAIRFAEPSEIIRGQQSPSWRTRHINLCRSVDQNNSNFNVWNSLQFPSRSPFQNFTSDDFKISKGLQMSFHENMNPWLLELEEPECVLPEEIDCHSSQMLSEPMKQVTTSITFASHQHSACFSDSSLLNVDVTEGSQCAGTTWGLLNSHFTEEQSPSRDLKQQTIPPSLFKIIGHSPDKPVTILEDNGGQNKKLLAGHFYQEEKLSEKSDFKCSTSEPHIHAHYSKNKEVHFCDNPTLIRMSSPLAAKEKTVTPDLPSHIFLEQRELFEQYTTPRADCTRKQHSLPPQHQNYVAPNLTGHASLEKEEKNRAPHIDHHTRDQSPFMQSQDCKTLNTPHSIFLEQRKLFEKSKIPDIDSRMRKDHPSLPQVQEDVVEKKNQHKSTSQVSSRINVEASKGNAVPQSKSNQFTLVTSAPSPPSNRKALSCVRITLGPKTSSKLDSGTLDKSFQSSDSASQTRMNHEFNSDLQMISSRSLEPTSKLLISKPKAQDQETFIKPSSDVKVTESPLPDNNPVTQDLKTKTLQNSQIVTSRQTQVNMSDLEGYHNSAGALLPVSADRPPEENKTLSPAFSGKMSSDAVTQITTESPDKTLFSSEIFITDKDLTYAIQDSQAPKNDKGPFKFASSSSIQKISVPHAPSAQPLLLPYKPSTSTDMYYVQQVSQIPGSLASKSDTTIESSHSGSNDAIAPDFPAQALGTRDDETIPVNIKHSEGIYSKRAVTKAKWPVEEKPFPKDNAVGSNDAIAPDFPAQALGTRDDEAVPVNSKHSEGIYSKRSVSKANWPVEERPYPKDNAVGSNDAIAPDFPAQALGTRDDEAVPVNSKHSEGIYSKRSVSKANWPVEERPYPKDNADVEKDGSQKEEIERVITKTAQPEEVVSLQKQTEGSSDDASSQYFAHQQNTKVGSLPDYKTIEQKEDIQIPLKTAVLQEPWSTSKESLQLDITGSEYPSEIENTTHSVFKSARFFIHHPVHLSNDQDICPESLERNVFMEHCLQDFIQHHPENHEKHTFLPPPVQDVEKTKKNDCRIENLGIGVNLENKEAMRTAKNQTKDYLECERPIRYPSRDHKVTPEKTVPHTVSLNELWNKYMERQRLQKTPDFCITKGLSLVERLDRLAQLLQNPITHSLLPSESTQDDSRGEQDVKELSCRQQQQKNKLQKKKRYKCLEKCHKYTGDVRKRKVLSNHEAARANQIKIEQIKFDKYILRKKPGYRCANNTSSDSRPSEESDLLTDTATNMLSTTSSPVDSDMLTQTDKEVTLHERSSSLSTIDTARLIQAFGHERVCLSPKQIKLYRNITDHQRKCLEKRNKKNKKILNVGHPLMISDHTRRKQIQVTSCMVPSDSVSSSAGSFWSSNSVICNKQDVKMLHKGIQAGNLEIVHDVQEHTRDVGMTFPTPSSSKGRAEEENGVATLSEEKRFLSNYCRNKKLRKNKPMCFEGVSWFIPVENVKSGPRKENLPVVYGPGISWFAPISTTKPWREPLREQNQQGQCTDNHKPLSGPPQPFVKATLQEALQLHRPDFISRSGERVKRLKLIVEERKLQNVLQSERKALFNTGGDCPRYQGPLHLFQKRGLVPAKTNGPIGKKEMILRSKRMYEQLPEVQKKRDEEKRKSEYTSYRLRAQLYKKKVTNHLLGRKVPWD